MAYDIAKRNAGQAEKVVLLIDNSDSMMAFWGGNTRLKAAVDAAETIISTSTPEQSHYAILYFGSSVGVQSTMTDDYITLLGNVFVPPSGGGTMMNLGIAASLQPTPDRIILLSDGAPTCYEEDLWTVVDTAVSLKVKIDTIAIDASADRIMKEIAKRTGGIYKHCSSPEELSAHFARLETNSRLMLEHQQ